MGYAGLYLFLTSIGAKADLVGILSAPVLLLVGAIWILIHVAFHLAGRPLAAGAPVPSRGWEPG